MKNTGIRTAETAETIITAAEDKDVVLIPPMTLAIVFLDLLIISHVMAKKNTILNGMKKIAKFIYILELQWIQMTGRLTPFTIFPDSIQGLTGLIIKSLHSLRKLLV